MEVTNAAVPVLVSLKDFLTPEHVAIVAQLLQDVDAINEAVTPTLNP